MVKANLGKDGIQVIKGFLELIGAPRSSREVSRQEAEVMILGSELDAHDSVTGKTRELLNKVVKAFPPEDSHTTTSFREPGSTVDRVLLCVGSCSEAAEVGVELIK